MVDRRRALRPAKGLSHRAASPARSHEPWTRSWAYLLVAHADTLDRHRSPGSIARGIRARRETGPLRAERPRGRGETSDDQLCHLNSCGLRCDSCEIITFTRAAPLKAIASSS